ncbi:MAG: sn-glycerol-3-phosphate ABC transporter substrate-binding protein, partial [Burkholderiaceae bacterium]
PGTEVAVLQLDASTTENSRGIRLGFLPQIREIEDGEAERIFAGEVDAEAGLKRMMERGNELLRRFEASVK